jgi:hypothetical protein
MFLDTGEGPRRVEVNPSFAEKRVITRVLWLIARRERVSTSIIGQGMAYKQYKLVNLSSQQTSILHYF